MAFLGQNTRNLVAGASAAYAALSLPAAPASAALSRPLDLGSWVGQDAYGGDPTVRLGVATEGLPTNDPFRINLVADVTSLDLLAQPVGIKVFANITAFIDNAAPLYSGDLLFGDATILGSGSGESLRVLTSLDHPGGLLLTGNPYLAFDLPEFVRISGSSEAAPFGANLPSVLRDQTTGQTFISPSEFDVNVVPVPAPGGAAVGLIAAGILAHRRRRPDGSDPK